MQKQFLCVSLTEHSAFGTARIVCTRNGQHANHGRRTVDVVLGQIAEHDHIVEAVGFIQFGALRKVQNLGVIMTITGRSI